ncbi:molybdopterin converting factor subunit 1 [Ideonella sp. B7]|nr:molybdopterin converting factor subunit 1 [Ideonella benzenivorans]
MRIQVLFFASLRETLGASRALELPAGATVAQARAHLAAESEAATAALAPGRPVRAAVNQTLAAGETVLAEGDELAFFPPVTGG